MTKVPDSAATNGSRGQGRRTDALDEVADDRRRPPRTGRDGHATRLDLGQFGDYPGHDREALHFRPGVFGLRRGQLFAQQRQDPRVGGLGRLRGVSAVFFAAARRLDGDELAAQLLQRICVTLQEASD